MCGRSAAGGAFGASCCCTAGAAGAAGFGVNTEAASDLSPGIENLRFLVSTTTALVRPCEKFWRTVPCSRPGRFSVRVFLVLTLKVLSSPVFVSLIPYPLRLLLRQQSPQTLPG